MRITRRDFAAAMLAPAFGSSAAVQTVRGPVALSNLSTTLTHEHVMVDFAGAQKTGRDRHFVELHVRQDVRDFERVNKVRLARRTLLAFVFLGGKQVGTTQQIEVRLSVVGRNFLYDVFNPDHRK